MMDKRSYHASFSLTLEGAVDSQKDDFGRMDKFGNACATAAALVHDDDHVCAAAQSACRGREDTGLIRVGDPWRSDEYVDITCPKFMALACGEPSDAQVVADACRVSLAGETVPDPFFVTPVSFLCGVVFAGAVAGAAISTSHAHPAESATHSDATTLLGAGLGVVGSIGCLAIPF